MHDEQSPPVWRMTPDDRVAHYRDAAFARYCERSESYFDAVAANGDEPWFSSLDERRALFMRRYARPSPPLGLYSDLAEIRKPEYRTDTTISRAVRKVQRLKPLPPVDNTTEESIAA